MHSQDCSLLIEPVWNRNVLVAEQLKKNGDLLIEPVWNRNMRFDVNTDNLIKTFNRTSMESKPNADGDALKHRALLIEPVWNRNFVTGLARNLKHLLLIEPVWNRNIIATLVGAMERAF